MPLPRVLGFGDGNPSDVFDDPLPTAIRLAIRLGGRQRMIATSSLRGSPQTEQRLVPYQ